MSIAIRPAQASDIDDALAIDEDSWTLFTHADPAYALSLAEQTAGATEDAERWRHAASRGDLLFAHVAAERVGMLALGIVDGRPYLAQLSVRAAWGRRGVGTALLEVAKCRSADVGELWLTTYGSVAWNGPWYERNGFQPVTEHRCGPEVRAILDAQRLVLAYPEDRIAMIYKHR